MAELIIYRNDAELTRVKIGENTSYSGQLMGENKVTSTFEASVMIDFAIGDYIQHAGLQYKLNEIPELVKSSRHKFTYTATFEGPEYTLYNKILRHLGAIEFSYHGTPLTFLQLIISNANEIDPGWVIGEVEPIEEGQLLPFNQASCRAALTQVAEAFKLEYAFNGKAISLKKSVGALLADVTLEYGKDNGLYTLTRQTVADSKIYTRVFGIGGSTNLPANYRGGLRNLSFDGAYVDRNVDIYGVIEGVASFPDINPKRTAAITDTPAINEVTDTTLDFNLNDVIVDGQAKIVFKTGDLAGNKFEILSYDHSTKKIKFDFNKEDNGYQLPNATVKAKVGDTYTLIGIEMPASYIATSEEELKAATIDFAEANKHPLTAFGLDIDEKFIRDDNLIGAISIGDRIRTIDTDMGVDKALRVQAISYPLSNPAKITATISDKVSYTITEKVIKELNSQKHEVKLVAKTIDQSARDNTVRRREFQNKVFDPTDGYFDGGNLRPKTVEAVHLAAGTRPQDFSLNLIFKPNYQGNVNRVQWTSGKLVHNTISDSGVRSWSIASGGVTGLIDANVYYIYAKCSKVGLDGVIVLDTAERRVDDDAIYYYFLIGQLSSNINGVRWPGLSYGSTEINGRFLTTGRAQSQDGKTYFDFDSSEIGGTIKFVSTNGTFKNVTEVEAATVQANNLADQAIIDAFNANSNASNALTAANAAKGVTDNFTTIDGGLIYSNTLKLGTSTNTTAGITGVVVNGDSIMIWAGATFENRHNAKFRVSYDGRVWMTDANITGTINATSGTIGGFQITPGGFGLNGSKVTIEPDKGIKSSGYFGLPKTFDAAIAPVNDWCIYVEESGDAQNPTVPQTVTALSNLTDVSIVTPTDKQLLCYDLVSGKWKNWTPNFTVDLSGYYTKTESDGRYLGVNATAANSAKLNGHGYKHLPNYSPSALMGYLDSEQGWRYVLPNEVKTFLGLGSSAYTNKIHWWSASHPDDFCLTNNWDGTYWKLWSNHGAGVRVDYSDNSAKWNGQTYTGATNANPSKEVIAFDATNGDWRPTSLTQLGLGASAFTAETLQSVTDRGSTTTNGITALGYITSNGGGGGIRWTSRQNNAIEWINYADNNGSYLFRSGLGNVTTVDNSGNVGLGTTSPLSKLHVNGAITIPFREDAPTRATGNYLELFSGFGFYYLTAPNNADLRINAKNILLTPDNASGNVGIGTTSPIPHFGGKALIVSGAESNIRGMIEVWGENGGKSILQSVNGNTYLGNLSKGTNANADNVYLTNSTGYGLQINTNGHVIVNNALAIPSGQPANMETGKWYLYVE